MSLTTGTRLALRRAQGDLEQGRKVGPYEIVALLGAGGMGEGLSFNVIRYTLNG